MTASEKLAQRKYRRLPKNKRKLKIRAKKNAAAPSKNMSWSSKTRSYVKKDPSRRRKMKLVARMRKKRMF